MRWQTLLGLFLIGASAYFGQDLMQDGKNPWPAYAEPQTSCGTDLAGIYEGETIKFRFPEGWKIGQRKDAANGVVETFLTPSDGTETTLFIREGAVSTVLTIPAPERKLRDAPNSGPQDNPQAQEPSGAQRLKDTDQALTLDEKRHGNAYLTRVDAGPEQVSFSWMAFVWDTDGRMAAVSGPRLEHSNWPHKRRRAKAINCAFWEILKTVEPK
ncbi:MAG: hypothetical protein HY925_13900 [Elusimicrobia bacterium]|nr:hypothetical protein [Elusimicrobiota bacterium]